MHHISLGLSFPEAFQYVCRLQRVAWKVIEENKFGQQRVEFAIFQPIGTAEVVGMSR